MSVEDWYWQGKSEENTCPIATLSNTDPVLTGLGSNLGLGWKRHSYDTALGSRMINGVSKRESDTGGLALQDVRLRTLDRWDRAFESHWTHGYSSLVLVAASWSLVRRSSTVCVCVCVFLIVCVCVVSNYVCLIVCMCVVSNCVCVVWCLIVCVCVCVWCLIVCVCGV
jgi:hypothetical protein